MSVEFVGWPVDWPQYKQPCFGSWNSRCDMLTGPCACGAWHKPDEFEMVDGVLFRYGKSVQEYTRTT